MERERPGFNSIFKLDHLSKRVQRHLSRVYATLAGSLLLGATGSYVHLQHYPLFFLQGDSFIPLLGIFIPLLSLMLLFPHIQAPENMAVVKPAQRSEITRRSYIRHGLFGLFSFSYGLSIGSLLEAILHIDPSIPLYSLIATSIVFLSFTSSALFSPRRSFLFLGGTLLSIMSMLSFASLLNLFFQSSILFNINLYLGLLIFCGYLIFDTQLMIERAENGNLDTIAHSLDLFIDFVSIFVRVMIVMAKRREDEERRNPH